MDEEVVGSTPIRHPIKAPMWAFFIKPNDGKSAKFSDLHDHPQDNCGYYSRYYSRYWIVPFAAGGNGKINLLVSFLEGMPPYVF